MLALFWSGSSAFAPGARHRLCRRRAVSSGYQLLTMQPPSFKLLHEAERNRALAAVPFLMFAAPFIIMRNTIRGAPVEDRGVGFAMLATIVAGFWSLMSGTSW